MTTPPVPPQPSENNEGSAPPPSYGAPMPAGSPAVSQTNTLATVALVTGILSFLCSGLLAIASIVTGVMGRKKAKELGGEGKGKATAGIILGVVNLVLTAVIIIVAIAIAIFAETNKSGDPVSRSDISLTNAEVEEDGDDVVQYSATVENTSDSDAAFKITIACTIEDDIFTQDYTTDELDPGESEDIEVKVDITPQDGYYYVSCKSTDIVYE